MIMSNVLNGTGVALITPFQHDGTVDFNGLTTLIEHCIKGKVAYLVVLGTTGETATLTKEEKEQVIAHIVTVTNKRVPLVIGIGGNNTAQVIAELQTKDLSDFSAVLSVCPMYNKPSQEGIFQHYKAISEASPLPILLYNVPSRTAVNMTASTTLRLAALDNIIGIKEAVGDFSQVLAILKDRPKDFLVISGDDTLALPLVAAGGNGVISVVAQAFPQSYTAMIRLGLEGKTAKAFESLYPLLTAFDYAFAEGNPSGIKSFLKAKGICGDDVRLPLISVSSGLANEINTFVHQYTA